MSLQGFDMSQDNLTIIYNRIARIALSLPILSIPEFDSCCEDIDLNFEEAQKMIKQMELEIKGLKDIKENDSKASSMVVKLKRNRKTFYDYKLRVFQIKEDYINTKKLRQKELEMEKANEDMKLLIKVRGLNDFEMENNKLYKLLLACKTRINLKKNINEFLHLSFRMFTCKINFLPAILLSCFYIMILTLVILMLLRICK